MAEGVTPDLIVAGAVVFSASVLVLLRPLGFVWSIPVALVKVAIPILYFGVFDSGDRLLDDVTYAEEAMGLTATGAGPVELLADPSATDDLFRIAEGRHIAYYVYNIFAQNLFGDHYWAAVLVNVFLVTLAARFVWRILVLLGFSSGYLRASILFFLLHWDVIAWSSFYNLKDSLVMMLSALMFLGCLELVVRPRLASVFSVAVPFFLFTFLRWYVPLLILGAFAGWGLLFLVGWKRVALGTVVTAGVILVLQRSIPVEMLQPGGALVGALRFASTPRPWAITDLYSFLLFPSVLHWSLAPVALVGAVSLWRSSPPGRLVIAYLILLVLFYSMVPEVQGPRHRYQGVFALAILQFHGLHLVVSRALARPFETRPAVAAVPVDASG